MTHRPLDPIILDQMYEHPERFSHLSKEEYFRILIEDIRYWRQRATRSEELLPGYVTEAVEIKPGEPGYNKAMRTFRPGATRWVPDDDGT